VIVTSFVGPYDQQIASSAKPPSHRFCRQENIPARCDDRRRWPEIFAAGNDATILRTGDRRQAVLRTLKD